MPVQTSSLAPLRLVLSTKLAAPLHTPRRKESPTPAVHTTLQRLNAGLLLFSLVFRFSASTYMGAATCTARTRAVFEVLYTSQLSVRCVAALALVNRPSQHGASQTNSQLCPLHRSERGLGKKKKKVGLNFESPKRYLLLLTMAAKSRTCPGSRSAIADKAAFKTASVCCRRLVYFASVALLHELQRIWAHLHNIQRRTNNGIRTRTRVNSSEKLQPRKQT